MDEPAIRAEVEAERLDLSALLDQLSPPEWARESLCPGWSVKEVVAHLTIPTRTSTLGLIRGIAAAGGSFHRMTFRQAGRRAAAHTPAQLIAQLRETAGSPRRMPGSAPMDPLLDVLVHGQDIVRPLGRVRPMPEPLAVAALDHVAANSFYGAPARLAGLQLVATDAAWSTGTGPAVRGPAADLLLVATGRPAGLDGLVGDGAPVLTARLGGVSDGRVPG